MKAWGFNYKSNIVWHKVRKDGGSDGRGVGFYFRNVTELILFGTRGKNARTWPPAGHRSIIWRHGNANNRASPTSNIGTLNLVRPAPIWRCSAVVFVPAG